MGFTETTVQLFPNLGVRGSNPLGVTTNTKGFRGF